MKNVILFCIVVSLCFLMSCSKKAPLSPDTNETSATAADMAESISLQLVEQSCWIFDDAARSASTDETALAKKRVDAIAAGRLITCNRVPISGNIVHYSFKIYLGPSAHDVIGLHRVVKEKRPMQPIQTNKAFFYQHGDCKDFSGMTLPGVRSANMARDFGIAAFLAQNDVDVWGIDQAWTLTPMDIAESSFMKNWGLQKQVDDLRMGMSIARFTRLFTGSGFMPLILCGYSSGVITGFALLNEETQLPPAMRNVAGFIPVDVPVKTNDQTVKEVFAAEYARVKELIDTGQYADMVAFTYAADFARSDPDGESPIIPGFTNMQTALFFGAGPLWGTIHYHFLAGIWQDELPVDFEYVTVDQWLDFMAVASPWEAAQFIADYCLMIADMEDVPFDDHFAQIKVPIFVVGAAGGMGEYCLYGVTLLGSSDITHHIVQFKSAENALYDFGHIDLFLAHDAEANVWRPILEWIEHHTP
ncbi:hypothetical protein JW998_12770 [candidate division KSB1 bacterium]|nr:hypothetical protein [candidate division KSB1 bacterium]